MDKELIFFMFMACSNKHGGVTSTIGEKKLRLLLGKEKQQKWFKIFFLDLPRTYPDLTRHYFSLSKIIGSIFELHISILCSNNIAMMWYRGFVVVVVVVVVHPRKGNYEIALFHIMFKKGVKRNFCGKTRIIVPYYSCTIKRYLFLFVCFIPFLLQRDIKRKKKNRHKNNQNNNNNNNNNNINKCNDISTNYLKILTYGVGKYVMKKYKSIWVVFRILDYYLHFISLYTLFLFLFFDLFCLFVCWAADCSQLKNEIMCYFYVTLKKMCLFTNLQLCYDYVTIIVIISSSSSSICLFVCLFSTLCGDNSTGTAWSLQVAADIAIQTLKHYSSSSNKQKRKNHRDKIIFILLIIITTAIIIGNGGSVKEACLGKSEPPLFLLTMATFAFTLLWSSLHIKVSYFKVSYPNIA
eukprot:gene8770-6171_t